MTPHSEVSNSGAHSHASIRGMSSISSSASASRRVPDVRSSTTHDQEEKHRAEIEDIRQDFERILKEVRVHFCIFMSFVHWIHAYE